MRTFVFTLLAIAIAVGIQWGVSHPPYGVQHIIDKFTLVLMLVLPVIATASLARAMRIPNLGYVVFLSIVSPFIAFISVICFALFVLNDRLL